MSWDYSIYPELTDAQKRALTASGETLYMIQMAEYAIQNCMAFVFRRSDFSLENFYAQEKQERRKTLGQIVADLRTRAEIHPQFDELLTSFVDKRNFFVHKLFNESEYELTSDERCSTTEQFLLSLQDIAWNVQNVFLGCLMEWTKTSGVFEHLPESLKQNKHLTQVEKQPFHMLFRNKQNNP